MAPSKVKIITSEDVETRYKKIMVSLAESKDFEFNLLVLQVSDWPNTQRRQLFRKIFKAILVETRVVDWDYITPYVRQNFRPISGYHLETIFIKSKFLEKVVNKIKQMESNNRFKLEKVFTLSKLPAVALMLPTACIKYMLENTLIVLGDKVSVQSTSDIPFKSTLQKMRYYSNRLDLVRNVYEDYGIDTSIIMDPKKMILVSGAIILKNVSLILDSIESKGAITPDNIGTLNSLSQVVNAVSYSTGAQIHKVIRTTKTAWLEVEKEYEALDGFLMMSESEFLAARIPQTIYIDKIISRINLMMGKKSPDEKVPIDTEVFDPFVATI